VSAKQLNLPPSSPMPEELTESATAPALARYFRLVRYSDTIRWHAKQIRSRSLTL
jgi:hypothetical protein